jgi:hypothetical protein
MASDNQQALTVARGLAGAAIGGALGWFAFNWLVGQGFYALALPGALVGLACGVLAGGASVINAAACAVIAIVLTLVLEWKHFPFNEDPSFGYFLSHIHQLRGITWLMLALGAVFAFWFGRGRGRAV